MLHSIYTITKTEVSFTFNEVSTETLSRVYISLEDAQDALRRETVLDLSNFDGFSEESLASQLDTDPERFEFNVDKDTQIIYQIHKTEMYQDQVEKLNKDAEYMEQYEKVINSR